MNIKHLNGILTDSNSPASFLVEELITTLATHDYQCVFIKDRYSSYQYANRNFIELMGFQRFEELAQYDDHALSISSPDAKKYQELDRQVIEEGQSIAVNELVSPQHNRPIIKTMVGHMHPLFLDNGRAEYVLGIVSPHNQLLRLSWDSVFKLTVDELNDLILKRNYSVSIQNIKMTVSKMELKAIVLLLRGMNANEIAKNLLIKQTTIESYIGNIKNKLGVSNKSELVHKIIQSDVLQQIIL